MPRSAPPILLDRRPVVADELSGLRAVNRLLSHGLAVLLFGTVAGLVLAYGFAPPLIPRRLLLAMEFACIAVFVAGRILYLLGPPGVLDRLRTRWADYAVIVGGALIAWLDFDAYQEPVRRAVIAYLVALGVGSVTRFGLRLYRVEAGRRTPSIRPGTLMVLSFVAIILLGGFLLSLPTATRPIVAGQTPYHWREHVLNCLFTACSATCVTGLTVYRTGQDFTLFGQVVILLLIQAGGLGIMVFGTVFSMLAGRRIGLRESVVVQDMLSQPAVGEITRMVKFVCMITFVIEGAGAVLLYPMWSEADLGPGGRWFWSVFHAVSAFCNAGFSLHENNLVPYRSHWQVYGSILPLIVLGGLGYPVLRELSAHAAGRLGFVARWIDAVLRHRPLPARYRPRPFSLHSRMALTTTAVLIFGGAALFFTLETPTRWNKRHAVRMDRTVVVPSVPDRMCALPPGPRALSALFLSVTPRTAGFNTVRMDEQSLSPATHYLLCMLMIVGGSPASTAGGIKTVTFLVLVAAVRSVLHGRRRTEAFRRTIPAAVVERAFVVAVLMLGMVFLVTWLLCYFEPHSMLSLLFETCSASGTVGLSTGITPNLTRIGRVLIMLCMLAGRVGPLTLLVALAGRERQADFEYPEEQPLIG